MGCISNAFGRFEAVFCFPIRQPNATSIVQMVQQQQQKTEWWQRKTQFVTRREMKNNGEKEMQFQIN